MSASVPANAIGVQNRRHSSLRSRGTGSGTTDSLGPSVLRTSSPSRWATGHFLITTRRVQIEQERSERVAACQPLRSRSLQGTGPHHHPTLGTNVTHKTQADGPS